MYLYGQTVIGLAFFFYALFFAQTEFVLAIPITQFLDGNIERLTEEYPDKYVLRANAEGQPTYSTKVINGVEYKAVTVEGKPYIPNN